ncbi:hypothetical protein AOG23_18690 [Rhizobium acidisoli]|nr:hypothetical protein AOG23_18690 [Rhizobium acidisoli]
MQLNGSRSGCPLPRDFAKVGFIQQNGSPQATGYCFDVSSGKLLPEELVDMDADGARNIRDRRMGINTLQRECARLFLPSAMPVERLNDIYLALAGGSEGSLKTWL